VAHFIKSLGLGIALAVLIVVLAATLVMGLLVWWEVLSDGFFGPNGYSGD
jgi:hypothetical protein